MPNVLLPPWYARPHLLQRSRQIVGVLTKHGLDFMMEQIGLNGGRPFTRRSEARRPGGPPINRPNTCAWPWASWAARSSRSARCSAPGLT